MNTMSQSNSPFVTSLPANVQELDLSNLNLKKANDPKNIYIYIGAAAFIVLIILMIAWIYKKHNVVNMLKYQNAMKDIELRKLRTQQAQLAKNEEHVQKLQQAHATKQAHAAKQKSEAPKAQLTHPSPYSGKAETYASYGSGKLHNMKYGSELGKNLIDCNSAKFKDIVLTKKQDVVVAFVDTERCGHCKNMLPALKNASNLSKIPFLLVENKNAPDILQFYNVTGLPTIFRFKNGKRSEKYDGPRTVESFVEFSKD